MGKYILRYVISVEKEFEVEADTDYEAKQIAKQTSNEELEERFNIPQGDIIGKVCNCIINEDTDQYVYNGIGLI